MPGSYAIQITGDPTTIQNLASGSPHTVGWPVFGTTDSEGVDSTSAALEATPTHELPETTPPTPTLDQLEKAAVVATFAGISLHEVSLHQRHCT